jgi:hypothetical protein
VFRPGFLTHFLRSEYGTLKLSPASLGADETAAMVARLTVFWQHTASLLWLAPDAAVAVFAAAAAIVLVGRPSVSSTSATASTPGKAKGSKGRAAAAPACSRCSAGAALVVAWLLYGGVFHYLANLPVDAAMPLGVLSRFWMQPDVLAVVVVGVAVNTVLSWRRVPGASRCCRRYSASARKHTSLQPVWLLRR